MKEMILKLAKEEDGAAMVEYILLIALIALVAAVGFTTLGTTTDTKTDEATTKLGGSPS